MYKDTVTIFNRYESKMLGTFTWYPHILRNVDLNVDKGANIEKTGLASADKAKLHIKYHLRDGKKMIGDSEYLQPKEWDNQTNDSYSQTITFTEGEDFFLLGEYPETPINDDDYREGFYSYINSKRDDVFKITTVGMYSLIPHFEIGGA